MPPRLTPARALALALLVAGCTPASAPEASPGRTTWQAEGSDAGIAYVHLTQSAQDLWGNIPLVQGRDALLRVFLGSRIAGLAAPAVHAQLVSTASGQTLRTYDASSPLPIIPTGTFAGQESGSWNVLVPGAEIQPGRHLIVQLGDIPGIAPGRVIATRRVPAIGSLDVRVVPPLPVTIVPIIQDGLVPDVQRSRTKEDWVALAGAMYPLSRIDVQVAAPYTTSVRLDGTDDTWGAVLDELVALRTTQGSTRHWIGAVRVTQAGIAGQGLLRGAVFLASDSAEHYQRIVAHELGHNLGLHHAPCGTTSGLDPEWPPDEVGYARGHIGYAGWDPRTGTILDPAATYDVMSYCGGPGTTWISDFMYKAALDALSVTSTVVAAAARPAPLAGAVPGAPARAVDPPLPVAAP